MKYEASELTALPPAINAIQGLSGQNKCATILHNDALGCNESVGAYADWED